MKKQLLSFFLLTASVTAYSQSPTLQWAKPMGSTLNDYGTYIAVDVAGNVYTAGWFWGIADFNPDPAVTYNLTSAGSLDIFVSKLDALGNFVWAKRMGGTLSDRVFSIALDAAGNVYTTGLFYGTADFNPDPAVTYNLISVGLEDIFVAKLDALGNFVWAKRMGGTGYDVGYSISVDASGNVHTTGTFQGTADLNPDPAVTYNLTAAASGYDIFVSKLDASGNFVWTKQMGGASYTLRCCMALDASGNVYTTGPFYGTADFDPDPAVTYNLTAAASGYYDIFVSKLDASGNFVWAKQMGGTSTDYSFSIALDAAGNVHTTGYFGETVDFDPDPAFTYNLTSAGGGDIFISKLDAFGNFVWAKQMGGTSEDNGSSIAVDASGNVYTTGYFGGTVDFDPDPALTYTLTSTGVDDIFVSELDASGNFVCAWQIEGTSVFSEYYFIALDASGYLYTTGYFGGTTDFDPDPSVTYNLTSAGSNDIYVTKYSICSIPLPIELLNFDAEKSGSQVRCFWSTATEINNDYFAVERSKDGITFTQIGTVQGAGNSSTILNYEFVDEHPYSGLSYYRLRQVDFNGMYSYSNIAAVYFDDPAIINVFPNPAEDAVSVLIGSPYDMETEIQVFNGIGQKIENRAEKIRKGLTTISIGISSYASGIYMFKITTPDGKYLSKEFIKR